MIKVRSHYFETNSSSSDVYDDEPDPLYGYGDQYIHIKLKWVKDLPEDIRETLMDDIIGNREIFEKDLCEFVDIHFKYGGVPGVQDAYEDDNGMVDIVVTAKCSAIIGFDGTYFPATREEPASEPDPIVDKILDGVPLKNEEYKDKDKDLQFINNIFKKYGWTYFVAVNIYGDEIDENEILDNIDY